MHARKCACAMTHTHTHTHMNRQTDRQTDRQIDRQTDTFRQIYIDKNTYAHSYTNGNYQNGMHI